PVDQVVRVGCYGVVGVGDRRHIAGIIVSVGRGVAYGTVLILKAPPVVVWRGGTVVLGIDRRRDMLVHVVRELCGDGVAWGENLLLGGRLDAVEGSVGIGKIRAGVAFVL